MGKILIVVGALGALALLGCGQAYVPRTPEEAEALRLWQMQQAQRRAAWGQAFGQALNDTRRENQDYERWRLEYNQRAMQQALPRSHCSGRYVVRDQYGNELYVVEDGVARDPYGNELFEVQDE